VNDALHPFHCPACGGAGTTAFHQELSVPTNSCLLLESREEAESFPRGDIALHVCTSCGFVSNAAFRPASAEYSSRYEETQGFSDTFNQFAWDLAKRWVERYGLQDRTVLEIGCGKGEFLEMMCEAGIGAGIGIDPSAHPERRRSEAAARIEWITDFYSEDHAQLAADAIVCRHTLEHIPDVARFMMRLRRSLGPRTDTVVLFELPDVRRVLAETAFWDVYYEHCSYFTAGSLARLFRATGFEVLDLSLDYDDQYLLIEARPADGPDQGRPSPLEADLDEVVHDAGRFSASRAARLEGWRERLAALRSSGGRAVIWGGGSKGVAFLTALDDDRGDGHDGHLVAAAVDINPHKHGMYIAGSGHRIVAPGELVEAPPDLVIVMNSVYVPEVREELAHLGLHPDVVGL
jgi:SAM-dependent methyltransferase